MKEVNYGAPCGGHLLRRCVMKDFFAIMFKVFNTIGLVFILWILYGYHQQWFLALIFVPVAISILIDMWTEEYERWKGY